MTEGKSTGESVAGAPSDTLSHILLVTDLMLAAAQQGDWQRVVLLEQERQECIGVYFGAPASASEAPRIAQAIHHVLRSDQELTALAAAARQQVAETTKALRDFRRFQQISKPAEATAKR